MRYEVFNMKVEEMPIFWEDSPHETNISMAKDSISMLLALFRQRQYKKSLLADFNGYSSKNR